MPNSCFICHTSLFSKIFTTYDRHYGHFDKVYNVFVCNGCGLYFIDPMITNDELFQMYDEEKYYSYQPFNDLNPNSFSYIKRFCKYLKRYIGILLFGRLFGKDPVENPLTASGRKHIEEPYFLDIGCGSGAKLYEMKKKGWHVTGVEIGKLASKIGNAHGLNIINSDLLRTNFKNNTFDYIRSNHSFEHITDPAETIEEAFRILKPGGIFLIGVPNTKSLPSKVFKKFWFYLGVPFHPYNYNTENLSLFLKNNQFELKKVHYVGNWQGLLGSIQIYLNRNSLKVSSDGKFTNLVTQIIFEQFARILNLLRTGDCIEILAQKPFQ